MRREGRYQLQVGILTYYLATFPIRNLHKIKEIEEAFEAPLDLPKELSFSYVEFKFELIRLDISTV